MHAAIVVLEENDLFEEPTSLDKTSADKKHEKLESVGVDYPNVPLSFSFQHESHAIPVEWTQKSFEVYDTEYCAYSRPEYLFVRVWKPLRAFDAGISVEKKGKGVIIAGIAKGGLFDKSNLRVGDRIMSINGMSCVFSSVEAVIKSIRRARSSLSIIVRNEGGNPSIVSNSIWKPIQSIKMGLVLKNRRGILYIDRFDPKGMFGNSLLAPGSRCLFLNDTNISAMSSFEAAEKVMETQGFVTIVSRPKDGSAMVLACDTKKGKWMKRLMIGRRKEAKGTLLVDFAT